MSIISLHYTLHGLIILMTGLIGGFPFAKAIGRKSGNETAWRVVHSGGSLAGVMLIAIGAVTQSIIQSGVWNTVISSGVIVSTYLLIAGMVLAAVTGERGIGDSKENRGKNWKTVYYLYGIGAFLSRNFFRRTDSSLPDPDITALIFPEAGLLFKYA